MSKKQMTVGELREGDILEGGHRVGSVAPMPGGYVIDVLPSGSSDWGRWTYPTSMIVTVVSERGG